MTSTSTRPWALRRAEHPPQEVPSPPITRTGPPARPTRPCSAAGCRPLGAARVHEADTFSLDLHPIPYRGDPTGLDQHYLPLRGSAGPSVQTFFALEQESRCLCYANAKQQRTLMSITSRAVQFQGPPQLVDAGGVEARKRALTSYRASARVVSDLPPFMDRVPGSPPGLRPTSANLVPLRQGVHHTSQKYDGNRIIPVKSASSFWRNSSRSW